jgi:hypothetical protein
MASSTGHPSAPLPDHVISSRDLHGLRDELSGRFSQARLDVWLSVSAGRFRALEQTYFGMIRWPKSLGRTVAGTLASGFAISGQYHLINPVTDGAIDLNGHWADLPPATSWDAADDDQHYRVNYFGNYMKFSAKVLANLLKIQIVGQWTHHITVAGPGYLLPDPLGFTFGSFDGKAIVLDEVTLRFNPIDAGASWSQRIGVIHRP